MSSPSPPNLVLGDFFFKKIESVIEVLIAWIAFTVFIVDLFWIVVHVDLGVVLVEALPFVVGLLRVVIVEPVVIVRIDGSRPQGGGCK